MQTNKLSIEQILLILAVIFFPITRFRIILPVTGRSLSAFFILLGMFFFLAKIVFGKVKLGKFEVFSFYYLFVYCIWHCICCLVGVQEYRFYHLVNLEQMDKLRVLLQGFDQIGLEIKDITAIKGWLSFIYFKACVWHVFLTYGVSVWFIHIYNRIKNNAKRNEIILRDITGAVTVLCLFLTIYSVIEIGYLRGNSFCAETLMKINPILYEPRREFGWWPPLLWPNQLRSLFVEPSNFGLFGVFIIPFLFYKLLKTIDVFSFVVYIAVVMMIFMSQARTAVGLYLLQLLLLFFYIHWLKHNYLKRCIAIVLVSILSFLFSIYLVSGFKTIAQTSMPIEDEKQGIDIVTYVENNVTSVVGEKRSNNARYAVLRANILTGMSNPVFGVGLNTGADVASHFSSRDLLNKEVNGWFHGINSVGPLKTSIPSLNQIAIEMARFGIPGVIIFLLPVFYIMYNLLKKLNKNITLELACVSIAYIGSLASFLSNDAPLPYYILTGLMVVLLHDEKERRFHENL